MCVICSFVSLQILIHKCIQGTYFGLGVCVNGVVVVSTITIFTIIDAHYEMAHRQPIDCCENRTKEAGLG